ncbi:MAG: hypothetical protein MHM6MM_001897 [Cercozoa sp. M6MM]
MAATRFKLVLLGEGRVGKTSLLIRYVEDQFTANRVSTLQAHFREKQVTVNGQDVILSIWDTAGQERFQALGPIYYRDALGALLVFDVTDRGSFNRVAHWCTELRKIVGDEIAIVIAENKIDLHKNRQVSEDEAGEFAKSVGAALVRTSAKTGEGVDSAFLTVAKIVCQRLSDKASASSLDRTASRRRRKQIGIVTAAEEEPEASGCC